MQAVYQVNEPTAKQLELLHTMVYRGNKRDVAHWLPQVNALKTSAEATTLINKMRHAGFGV